MILARIIYIKLRHSPGLIGMQQKNISVSPHGSLQDVNVSKCTCCSKSSRQFVSFGSLAGVWCTSRLRMFSRQREDGPPWLMRFRTTWAWGDNAQVGVEVGTLEFGWIWRRILWDFILCHLKTHNKLPEVSHMVCVCRLGCQDRTTGNTSQPGHVSLSSYWVACKSYVQCVGKGYTLCTVKTLIPHHDASIHQLSIV